MDFKEQYKHPRWQKKRLEVLSINGFECQNCGTKENQLHVHHPIYKKGAMIWEYEDHELIVLCDDCHKKEHGLDQQIKEEMALLVVLSGFSEKKELLGWLKAANLGPWTRLNTYDEVNGFLNYFGITGKIKEYTHDSLCNLGGDTDSFVSGLRTSYFDIGRSCESNKTAEQVIKMARSVTKKRMSTLKGVANG